MQNVKKLIIIIAAALVIAGALFYSLRQRGGYGGGHNATAPDQEIQMIFDKLEPPSEFKPTSIDNIDEAYATRKIDAERFAIYELLAVYSPDKVPAEYRGKPDQEKDQDYLFSLIHQKWDTFSQKTKDAIFPFLLPPNDPKSFYFTETDSAPIFEKLLGAKQAKADDGNVWHDIKPFDGATVSYRVANEARDFHPATWAVDTLQLAVPKYQDLLGVTMKKISLFITDPEKLGDSYGVTSMSETVDDMCMVKIKGGMDEKITKSTVAHELFHCFQHFMDLNYENVEIKWLTEATATWAEDFIYKNFQTEHEYDTSFLRHTTWDLLDRRDVHHYGSYLWFYFLTQQVGPEQVAFTLQKSKAGNPRKVLADMQNFQDDFKEFVFWNWNYAPYNYYRDNPSFPDIHPGGNSYKKQPISSLGNYNEAINLVKASSKYFIYYFPNDRIKKIEFDNKELNSGDQGKRALQAVYKVGDSWYYEDWSDLEKRTFCRDIDGENVKVIVIIPSNSDLYQNTGGNLKIKTENKCNSGWKGSVKVSWNMNQNLNPQGTWRIAEKGSYTVMEELEYNSEKDNLDAKISSFTASYSSSEIIQGRADDCTPYEGHGDNIYGAGMYQYTENDTKNYNEPVRFGGAEILESGKLGGTYSLNLGLPNPPLGQKNPLHGTYWSKKIQRNCSFILSLPNFGGIIDTTGPINDASMYNPNPVDIIITPGTKRVTGSTKFEIHPGVFGTAEWDYQKIN